MAKRNNTGGSKGAATKYGEPTGAVTKKSLVKQHIGEILSLYSRGFSWQSIAEQLRDKLPPHSTGFTLGQIVRQDPETSALLQAVLDWKAQYHFEQSQEMARRLEIEDPKAAGELHLKIAKTLDPQRYGDKATISVIATRAADEMSDADLARIAQRQMSDVVDMEAFTSLPKPTAEAAEE